MLFFPREFEVTQNKTEFILTDPFWTEFIRATEDSTLTASYARFLETSHKAHDHEVCSVFSVYLLNYLFIL